MKSEGVVVIPDTHGQVGKVEQLVEGLDHHGYLSDRKLVFLGDYVDRGPAVRQLLDFCIDLQKDGHIMLAGNHEYTLLRALQDGPDRDKWVARWGQNYEEDTLASYGVKYRRRHTWAQRADKLRERMPEAHLRFLESLPWMWESKDVVAVHAGIDPQLSWAKQKAQLKKRIHPDERGPAQLFSHKLATQKIHNIGKVVVSGHASRMQPYVSDTRVMLDCGVDQGGMLVAWVSDTQEVLVVA